MPQSVKIDRKLIVDAEGGLYFRVINGSGGALAPGDVVIWDTTPNSTGHLQVTTATSADDKLAAGVITEQIAANDQGLMQWGGASIVDLKVDGTDDISVGDPLGTFTTAKIASKGTTGKAGKFAIALEAYTTNDSNGTIRAIMVLPNLNDNSAVVATLADSAEFEWGTGTDAVMGWQVGDASNHTFVLGLGDTNQAFHITDKAAIGTDWNVSADTDPTVYIHSNTTPATDYISIGAHDGTSGFINVGGGTTLTLAIAGTDEIDLTATALSPATSNGNALGTTSLMWSDLFLASGAVVNFNNGDVTLTHASNSLTVEGGNFLVAENQGWFGTAASTTNAINATKDFGEAAGSNFNGMVLKAVGSETTGATAITTSGIQSLAGIGGSGYSVTNNQNWTATVGLRGVTAAVRTESGSSGIITGGAAFYAANATENGATYTNQYGLYIEDLTVGGSDYGVYIVGADTAAIYVASADPIHLGVAGASTGKLEIDGATSGTVTTTVAAAAGTWTLTLPPDNGDASEQLQTNGSGVTTWQAAGSLPAFKDRYGILNPADALQAMLGVDTELFNYREVALDGSRTTTTGDFDTEYAGVMADAAPWAMHHNGRIFNPVNAFGYTRAAIEALHDRIRALESR